MGIFYDVKVIYKRDATGDETIDDALLAGTRWWRTVGVTLHRTTKIDDPDDLVELVPEGGSFYAVVTMGTSLE